MTDLKPIKYIELEMDLISNTPLSHTQAENKQREEFQYNQSCSHKTDSLHMHENTFLL